MPLYIGADLGTSALKLLLVNEDGEILRRVSHTYPVAYPQPGWSEQEPQAWWQAMTSGISELLCGMDASAVKGIGVGGQMHGLVVLDEADEVIRPAILWNDGRTNKETDYLNNVVGKEVLSAHTANIAFAGFTAPKLLWMRENEPENFSKIRKMMLPKDYINYRLSGVYASDFSDASGMLLLDVEHRCWSTKMLELCGLTEAQMPALFESYQPLGTLLPELAIAWGLPADVVVVAGAGDNAAAAVGTGIVGEGGCNISLGTSGTIFLSSKKFLVDPCNALHAFCHADGGYHLMGCILSAASCNKWFCEDILGNEDYAALQSRITLEMLGRNHVYFLPYLMGERSPINDTDARGTFVGMRMDTTQADMLLAVLEGVAFAIRDNLEVARSQGLDIPYSYLCGGGARSSLWQKIFCHVLNIPIRLPQTEEGPGYGGAMLAMVGCGAYKTVQECAEALVQTKEILYPDSKLAAQYEARYRQFSKIYPTMEKVFKEIL